MVRQYSKFVGYLSEKNLKKETSMTKNGMPCELISGSIAIKVDDVTQYLNVYTKSKTNKGEENGMYESIFSLYNNCIPLSVSEDASYIMVKATPRINDYKDKNGQFHEGQISYAVNSVERCDPNKNKERIVINLTGYVNNIRNEFEDGEETGRKIVEVVGINYYDEAEPFNVYIEAEHADAIEDAWSIGDTIQPVCTLKNHATVGTSKRTSLIGVETSVTYDRQLTMINAFPPIEDEDKQIDSVDVKKAMNARALKIEELKHNNTSTKKTVSVVNIEVDDDDECPF